LMCGCMLCVDEESPPPLYLDAVVYYM